MPRTSPQNVMSVNVIATQLPIHVRLFSLRRGPEHCLDRVGPTAVIVYIVCDVERMTALII